MTCGRGRRWEPHGGSSQGYAQFVDPDGNAIDKGGPSFGIAFVGGREQGPLRLVDDGGRRSRAPGGPDEVAMDVDTARDRGFRVGDQVDVLSAGPRETFTLVGLFTLGEGADTGPLTFAAFDAPDRAARRRGAGVARCHLRERCPGRGTPRAAAGAP